ncbi:DUF3524 domain-containing protein [Oceaniserpentilla sp. 4NH20-0058]|uniref:tRNA-queuosine alpha-mannosyltransferase domain-containing protein n=1 Tax=Oceaniserpentilla sp. 4NH20-0058 TaxID=3127660 RepID=UPI00310336F9
MRILLLSAYDTDSHKSWCEGLMKHLSHHQWCYLTLPGRFFSWRIRGNALSFAYGDQAKALHQPFDLIIATSMVDLATLKGVVPNLANIPSLLYFHENQFAYPKSKSQHASIEPQMVNLYSALSASKVLFNSHYNQQSFIQGVETLLKKLPDHAPTQAVEAIKQKSQVLSVPILNPYAPETSIFESGKPLKVIWNHRWEYDKGPDTLANTVKLAEQLGLNVLFTICGMSFRQIPESFKALKQDMPSNITHMGTFKSRADYLQQLSQHHVVLSTAIHEFQGLAVLEGAANGCIPLAPNRLAYPEWIPTDYLYSNTNAEHIQICQQLEHWQQHGLPPVISVTKYDWQKMIHDYESIIQELGKH